MRLQPMRPFLLSMLLSISLLVPANSQNTHNSSAQSESSRLYRIAFERGEPFPAVAGSRSIAVPLQCLAHGTAFVKEVMQPTQFSPPLESLVSISRSGDAHEFRLDQIRDLYDIEQKSYYATESNVVFLVIAAPENKRGKVEFVTSDGTKHEVVQNVSEHHDYVVVFDRSGDYKKSVQIDDTFAVQRIGVFPSGSLLCFGFDRQDHSPKLAMLKEDGTLLRLLEIPKNAAPASMFGTQDGKGDGPAIFAKPVQFVPHRNSIIVVQNRSKFPLLEVNEAGAIREIKPKLPDGVEIDTLIPSDENLFARVRDINYGSIYELNPQNGAVLRRFQVSDKESDSDVACVHDGKFLSFENHDGKLVPLIGTTEPASEHLQRAR